VSLAAPSLTIGIEEEYLLVDRRTRDLASDPPEALMAACEARIGGRVTREFLRAQVEVGTGICRTAAQARAELAELRRAVADVAAEFGLAPIAASTHPFARWHDQQTTPKDRYAALARDLQGVARRLVICGMHVHAGIEDADLRIDLMNQAAYFLPHLLCLTTSSPFWQGEDTGLKSYRLTVFDSLPRTGVPDQFASWAEFQRTLDRLVGAGIIEDGTKLWWDIRPSVRFPTLEMRVTDICTRIDDAIAVAALYQALLHMLFRLRQGNQRWRTYLPMLVMENRWRAQRYGAAGSLVDFGKGETVPFAALLDEMLEVVRTDADALGSVAEIEHAREIVRRGTSADRQLHVHNAARQAGADETEAMRAVVDTLIEDTVAGV
jgi:carboxylate-amine ligase